MALGQITVAKKDIEIRSKREAMTLSIQMSDMFDKEIRPIINKVLPKIFLKYQLNGENIKNNEDKMILFNTEEMSKMPKLCEIYPNENDEDADSILNRFETIAVGCLNGVADEYILWNAQCLIYCYVVSLLYPYLCYSRKDNDLISSEIVKLYNIWMPRIKAHHLENQLKSVSEQLRTIPKCVVDPLGSK
jgi:hypothetical protein